MPAFSRPMPLMEEPKKPLAKTETTQTFMNSDVSSAAPDSMPK
jgi:hypothetical protein